jgi:hypothetical protein
MNYVLDRDSRNYLNYVSSTVFDNRLLFTCSPKVDYSNSPILSTGKRRPVTFSGLVALDFTSITGTGGKRSPAYDGIWTGLDVVQLYSGSVAGIPKAYAVNLDYVNSGLLGLWEITKDREYDIVSGGSQSPISSILETRAMSLGKPTSIFTGVQMSTLAGDPGTVSPVVPRLRIALRVPRAFPNLVVIGL